MPIIFARVDDRLIHGQVVQAWLPELNVDEILIPCLKGKESCLNRGLLRLSLPYEYELTILDSHSCARYAENSKRRIFLLMSSLANRSDSSSLTSTAVSCCPTSLHGTVSTKVLSMPKPSASTTTVKTTKRRMTNELRATPTTVRSLSAATAVGSY